MIFHSDQIWWSDIGPGVSSTLMSLRERRPSRNLPASAVIKMSDEFQAFHLKASLSKVRKSSFMKEDSCKLWSFILLRKIFRTSLCKTGSPIPATWFSFAQSPQQVSGMECNLFGIHRGIEKGEGNKILGRKWVNVQHNFPIRIIISLFFTGEQHMTKLNSYWGKSVPHSLLIFILGLTLDHSPSKL